MSKFSDMLLLLSLAAVVVLWMKLNVARERAVLEARRQCELHGLQLLDETVGMRGMRLRRVNGLRMIERCYGFEVSIHGNDRQAGRLWMIGHALTSVSLPSTEVLPPERPAEPRLSLPESTSNVVTLRPRIRTDERLH